MDQNVNRDQHLNASIRFLQSLREQAMNRKDGYVKIFPDIIEQLLNLLKGCKFYRENCENKYLILGKAIEIGLRHNKKPEDEYHLGLHDAYSYLRDMIVALDINIKKETEDGPDSEEG